MPTVTFLRHYIGKTLFFNIPAASINIKNFIADKSVLCTKTAKWSFLSHHLRDLGVTYALHLAYTSLESA